MYVCLAVKVQASARSFVSINSNYNLCSRLQAVFSFSSGIVEENEQASEWVSCINAAGNLRLATLAAWHARHVSTTRAILAPVRFSSFPSTIPERKERLLVVYIGRLKLLQSVGESPWKVNASFRERELQLVSCAARSFAWRAKQQLHCNYANRKPVEPVFSWPVLIWRFQNQPCCVKLSALDGELCTWSKSFCIAKEMAKVSKASSFKNFSFLTINVQGRKYTTNIPIYVYYCSLYQGSSCSVEWVCIMWNKNILQNWKKQLWESQNVKRKNIVD